MEAYSRVYTDGDPNEEQSMAATKLTLYGEHIQKAGGPFLDIRYDRFVVLQDPQAVRSLFDPVADASTHEIDDTSLCRKCGTALLANDMLNDYSQRSVECATLCYFLCTNRRILELLLDNPQDANNRADINGRDGNGETPFHMLLCRQKISIEFFKGCSSMVRTSTSRTRHRSAPF